VRTQLASTDARIAATRRGNLTLVFQDAGTGEPLRAFPGGLMVVLRRHEFYFGTSYRPQALRSTPDKGFYQRTTAAMFNSLVAEDIFTWPV
jgi:hypothetical protein